MGATRLQARVVAVIALTAGMAVITSGVANADIYWTNAAGTTKSVGTAALNGTGIDQNILAAADESPVFAYGDYVYWNSSDSTISRARQDGTGGKTSFVTGLSYPARTIAVSGDYLYWTEYGDYGSGAGRAIYRVPLAHAATEPASPFVTPKGNATGLVVDAASNSIYWSNSIGSGWGPGSSSIGRSNLTGGNVNQDFVTDSVADVTPLVLAGGRLFWSNFAEDIHSAKLNGAGAPDASVTYLTAGPNLANALGLAFDGTYLYWSNDQPLNSVGRGKPDGTGIDGSFIPGASGQSSRVWGLNVASGDKTQAPAKGCVTTPRHIRATGVTRLMKPHCKTNAGKGVTVKVSGGVISRGDMRLFRVYKNKRGATVIRTYGRELRLKVHWSAPKTTGYESYSQTKRYRT